MNVIYNNLVLGSVKINHLFNYSSEKPGILTTAVTIHEKFPKEQDFKVKSKLYDGKVRFEHIFNKFPVEIPKPVLDPRKQLELFKKWRPLVPERFHDLMCPEPST